MFRKFPALFLVALIVFLAAPPLSAGSPCPDYPGSDLCLDNCFARLLSCIAQVSNQVGGDFQVCQNRYNLCTYKCVNWCDIGDGDYPLSRLTWDTAGIFSGIEFGERIELLR